jgi:hypothetical protein
MTPQPRDLRRVAEEVRDEKDSVKMMALVVELDRPVGKRRQIAQAATLKNRKP